MFSIRNFGFSAQNLVFSTQNFGFYPKLRVFNPKLTQNFGFSCFLAEVSGFHIFIVLYKILIGHSETSGVDSGIFCHWNFESENQYEVSNEVFGGAETGKVLEVSEDWLF
jgi:hypothetical protein